MEESLSFERLKGEVERELESGSFVFDCREASTTFFIKEGAHAEVFIKSSGTARYIFNVGRDAKLSVYYLWEDGDAKSELVLSGERSEAHDTHFFVQNGRLKVNMLLRHVGKNTRGSIFARGLVMKQGVVELDGMIKIEKSGSGADSILEEHVMLLEEGAQARANPELEIENNDVSSTHAASVAQIDENALFYLRSRGIPFNAARKLLIEGFMERALERVVNQRARSYVRHYVFNALRGV